MSFIAVVRLEPDGRIAKFAEFETESEADAHIVAYGGLFAVARPAGGVPDWLGDADARTLIYSPETEAPAAARARLAAEIYVEQQRRRGIATAMVTIPGPATVPMVLDAPTGELLSGFQARWAEGRNIAATVEFGAPGAKLVVPAQVVRMVALAREAYLEAVMAASADRQEALGLTDDESLQAFDAVGDSFWPSPVVTIDASNPAAWPAIPTMSRDEMEAEIAALSGMGGGGS